MLVCLIGALNVECLDPENSFLAHKYIFMMSKSPPSINVMGKCQGQRSQKAMAI